MKGKNSNKERIIKYWKENPGCTFMQCKEALGLSSTSIISHHLRKADRDCFPKVIAINQLILARNEARKNARDYFRCGKKGNDIEAMGTSMHLAERWNFHADRLDELLIQYKRK